jgi:hypothetical protein
MPSHLIAEGAPMNAERIVIAVAPSLFGSTPASRRTNSKKPSAKRRQQRNAATKNPMKT